jgi:hypothetical protein
MLPESQIGGRGVDTLDYLPPDRITVRYPNLGWKKLKAGTGVNVVNRSGGLRIKNKSQHKD